MRSLRSLLELVPRRGMAGAALTLATGAGAGQIVTIGSAPILTRIYSPAEMGIFAVAVSILAILLTVTCLTYDFAIPLPGSDDTGANVVALCLVTTVAMSLLTAVVIGFAGTEILTLMGASVLGPYAMLLAVAQLAGGIGAALTAWAIRTKSYGNIALSNLLSAGSMVATQIGLGLLGGGAVGLLVGVTTGSIVGSSRLAYAAARSYAASFARVSVSGVVAAARRYRRFPLLAAPSNLLNVFALQAPLLLLVALYGASVGGQFALAQRVVAIPTTLLSGAIGQAFLGEAASVSRESSSRFRSLFLRTTRSLAVTAVLPFGVAVVAAPLAFGIVFGADWEEAGLYVAILAPMYFLQFLTNPTASTLDLLERQDIFLFREIIRLAITSGVVLAAWELDFTAIQAVVALSAAGCVAYALSGLLSWYAILAWGRRERAAEPKPSLTSDAGE